MNRGSRLALAVGFTGLLVSVLFLGAILLLVERPHMVGAATSLVLRGSCVVAERANQGNNLSQGEIRAYEQANRRLLNEIDLPLKGQTTDTSDSPYLNDQGGEIVGVNTNFQMVIAYSPDHEPLAGQLVAHMRKQGWVSDLLQTTSTYEGSLSPGGMIRYVSNKREEAGVDFIMGPERPDEINIFVDYKRYEAKPKHVICD